MGKRSPSTTARCVVPASLHASQTWASSVELTTSHCAHRPQDCDIYLIDACAQVTIDNAKNCRLFVGPCEGRCVSASGLNGV